MATTQNTYTGNGSTVLFSFTFPYLETTDIKVSLNGTVTTAYTLANATTIQFNTAPAVGAAIRIYRQTDDSNLQSTFYPGSAIRSQDLNDNFTQNLYVTQEVNNVSAAATASAASAVTTANTALSSANTAVSTANAANATANTASSNASTAVTTANTASTTATTASTNASNAVTTANTALSTANAATTTANNAASSASSAVSTANTASTNATAAVTTANAAQSAATSAVSTANSAVSTANAANATAAGAVTTANTAATNAATAITTANTADIKADAAIAAVASSVNYVAIANVAAIPVGPANNTYIEVQDTTGLESFSPMSGRPVSFVGDSGLKARLRFTTSGSTWVWIDYQATDQDGRYLKKAGGTMTGNLTLAGAPSSNLHAATKAYVDAADATLTSAAAAAQSTANTGVANAATAQSTANTAVSDAAAAQATATAALPKAGGTMTGNITFAGGQTFPTAGITSATTSTAGVVQLSDATNSSSSTTAATSAALKAVQDFAQVVSTTANAAMPKAGGTFTGAVTLNSTANIAGNLTVDTNTLYVDATNNRVGIGTTSPADSLHLGGTNQQIRIDGGGGPAYLGTFNGVTNLSVNRRTSDGAIITAAQSAGYINIDGSGAGSTVQFHTASAVNTQPAERARIDSSGRLLVGTSTSSENATSVFQGSSSGSTQRSQLILALGASNPANNATLGICSFSDSGHKPAAWVFAARDGGTWNSGSSQPSRLVFSTTADGASSPTERMSIKADGTFLINKTVSTINTPGVYLDCVNVSSSHFTQSNAPPVLFNRTTNDGSIVELRQDGTTEGTISVSGTTVSYNGAHLSRWSQLPGGAEREDILRGTVLSNIDEMCDWGEEDNEQLNRMKVSDIEGDPNVAGVFQAWDDDDDTYTDDFYCAMTGDFIIRISAGIPVHRGQLLMSAGDGTAKPQDDDIVRSKTIAKVTSNHITCTYDDGSYCVPCVLMAC